MNITTNDIITIANAPHGTTIVMMIVVDTVTITTTTTTNTHTTIYHCDIIKTNTIKYTQRPLNKFKLQTKDLTNLMFL